MRAHTQQIVSPLLYITQALDYSFPGGTPSPHLPLPPGARRGQPVGEGIEVRSLAWLGLALQCGGFDLIYNKE